MLIELLSWILSVYERAIPSVVDGAGEPYPPVPKRNK